MFLSEFTYDLCDAFSVKKKKETMFMYSLANNEKILVSFYHMGLCLLQPNAFKKKLIEKTLLP